MFGFFIKKNFFDGWDNMLYIIVPNLFMICILCIFGFTAHWVIDFNTLLAFLFLFVGFIGLVISTFAFGETAKKISENCGVTVKEYFTSLKSSIIDGLLFSAIIALLFLLVNVAVPFYVSLSSSLGLLLAALVVWLVIISLLALQWFLPIRSLMHNNFLKTLKKCFILFFDNPLFSIGLFLYDTVLVFLSIPIFLVIPSFSGVALAQVNAVRLRLLKYDWIEENPNMTKSEKRNVPWKELLKEEKQAMGNRSLKSLIFPGKY